MSSAAVFESIGFVASEGVAFAEDRAPKRLGIRRSEIIALDEHDGSRKAHFAAASQATSDLHVR